MSWATSAFSSAGVEFLRSLGVALVEVVSLDGLGGAVSAVDAVEDVTFVDVVSVTAFWIASSLDLFGLREAIGHVCIFRRGVVVPGRSRRFVLRCLAPDVFLIRDCVWPEVLALLFACLLACLESSNPF